MGSSRYCVIAFLLCSSAVASYASLGPDSAGTLMEMLSFNVSVPAGNELQQFLYGVGVQIYQYNGSSWVFSNVSSYLFNSSGIKVGHHFYLGEKDANGGQPSWETFRPEYSLVTAKAILVDPQLNTIPLLLLQATNNTGPSNLFGGTTFVQRLFTRYGEAPAADVPAVAGDIFFSSYSALYGFSTNTTTVLSR